VANFIHDFDLEPGNIDEYFEHYRRRFEEDGYEAAFWEAVMFCAVQGIPGPDWVREYLADYAKDRMNENRRVGDGRHPDYHRDGWIYVRVNFWRTQQYDFRGKGKLRHYSFNDCYRKIADELNQSGMDSVSPIAIEKVYKKVAKLLASKTPPVSLLAAMRLASKIISTIRGTTPNKVASKSTSK
jgi:hypothetical protein